MNAGKKELEIQFILDDPSFRDQVESGTRRLLSERMSNQMVFNVRFVEFIDHDYRRKYRVIERIGDIEFAGGMVGDNKKANAIQEIVAQSEAIAK